MILYEECKRLDKVRGKQKIVKGKLRDQCMLCEFYEMCNSCFFFGSSNAEKEAGIAAMISSEGTKKLDTVLSESHTNKGLYVHPGVSSDRRQRLEALRNLDKGV